MAIAQVSQAALTGMQNAQARIAGAAHRMANAGRPEPGQTQPRDTFTSDIATSLIEISQAEVQFKASLHVMRVEQSLQEEMFRIDVRV